MLILSRGIAILLFLSLCPLVSAASSPAIAINEIAWMGSEISSYDEWIELYNNNPSTVSVDGWTLKNADGALIIVLRGSVSPYGFYLLERTDDNSVPGVKADLVYKGTLKNNGEKLDLFDNLSNLIDSVDCKKGWFAGDNGTKKTMERGSLEEWYSSQKKGGTPKAKNSKAESPETSTLLTEEEKKPLNGSGSKQAIYPSGIIFNEILPSPEGEDAEEEWVEIFNENSFEVDISGWKISDTTGKTTSYLLPEGTKIGNRGFLVLRRPETKIVLNNDGDGLRLLNPNGETEDEMAYEKTVLNQSYGLFGEKWEWGAILTPGEKNEKRAPFEEELSSEKAEQASAKTEMAAIGEQALFPQKTSPPFPLFVSLIIASLSGITILFVKKLQQNKNLLQ